VRTQELAQIASQNISYRRPDARGKPRFAPFVVVSSVGSLWHWPRCTICVAGWLTRAALLFMMQYLLAYFPASSTRCRFSVRLLAKRCIIDGGQETETESPGYNGGR